MIERKTELEIFKEFHTNCEDGNKVWISEDSLPDFDAVYKNALSFGEINRITAYNYLLEVIDKLKQELNLGDEDAI
jgi:hypothetical protein